jgi:hypothetical protein
MSERLKVVLAGGNVEYLDLTATNAHGLESLIVQGTVEKEWLPTEDGKGFIRVGAIVGIKVEGKPDNSREAESDRLTRLEDAQRLVVEERRRSAGRPPTDDRSVERRIH